MMQDFLFYKILVPIIEYGISFRINQAALRMAALMNPADQVIKCIRIYSGFVS